MRHINICIVLSILIILPIINNVSALTAAIQNCKVVVYPTVGENFENCIKVINRNEEQIRIEISAEGDIKDDFEFLENNITLEAGEEKKVYYNIKPVKSGTTEMNIIVKFIPEEGSGIILPAKLTVVASEKNAEDDTNDDDIDDNTNDNSNEINNNTNNVNVNFGGNGNSNPKNDNNTNKKLSPYVPLIITGGILLVILIILIVIGKKPKQVQNNNESINKNNKFYKENIGDNSKKLNTKKRLKEPRE